MGVGLVVGFRISVSLVTVSGNWGVLQGDKDRLLVPSLPDK